MSTLLKDELGLRDLRRRWRTFEMLSLAHRTGILDLLAKEPVHSGDVASALELDPRVTAALLRHLAAAGVLAQSNSGFHLPRERKAVYVAFAEMAHEAEQVRAFDAVLRTGVPVHSTVSGISREDPEDRRHFLRGLYRRSGASVHHALRIVERIWMAAPDSRVRDPHILDLGGGHGRFAEAFAERFPRGRATLFEQPHVVPIARDLSGSGYESIAGDYLPDELGGPYDIAWISNILTCETDERALALLKRVRACLHPMGSIVLRDRMLRDDHRNALSVTDFGLILAAGTDHGVLRTHGETTRLLSAAGFAVSAIEELDDDYGYVLARA